jgi:hypothetical protein
MVEEVCRTSTLPAVKLTRFNGPYNGPKMTIPCGLLTYLNGSIDKSQFQSIMVRLSFCWSRRCAIGYDILDLLVQKWLSTNDLKVNFNQDLFRMILTNDVIKPQKPKKSTQTIETTHELNQQQQILEVIKELAAQVKRKMPALVKVEDKQVPYSRTADLIAEKMLNSWSNMCTANFIDWQRVSFEQSMRILIDSGSIITIGLLDASKEEQFNQCSLQLRSKLNNWSFHKSTDAISQQAQDLINKYQIAGLNVESGDRRNSSLNKYFLKEIKLAGILELVRRLYSLTPEIKLKLVPKSKYFLSMIPYDSRSIKQVFSTVTGQKISCLNDLFEMNRFKTNYEPRDYFLTNGFKLCMVFNKRKHEISKQDYFEDDVPLERCRCAQENSEAVLSSIFNILKYRINYLLDDDRYVN